MSLTSQLIGGLLILYSIDSNIGVVKQKTLLLILANYFKDFPLIKKPAVLELHAASASASGIRAKITTARNPQSVDEKIAYLQEQINEVRRDWERESKETNEKIDRKFNELNEQTQYTKTKLGGIESKIDEVATGGINIQLFGVLLMCYGAYADYMV